MRKLNQEGGASHPLVDPQSGSNTPSVAGATSPHGERWLNITCHSNSAWVPYALAVDPTAMKRRLVESGILLIGTDWKRFIDQVVSLREFPERPLIEQPGWSGGYFALVDGTVFSPPGADDPHVLFETHPSKCAHAGSATGWRIQVAKPLIDQPLPSFALMLAFTAPLLRLTDRVGNFGFELVGVGGTGKSTIQQLMASAAGNSFADAGSPYWITLDATRAGLGIALQEHSDMPIILEEANLFAPGESDKARGQKLRDLAFQLSSGHEKLKDGAPRPRSFRTVYLVSTNQSLGEMTAGQSTAAASAAADRLITLPVPPPDAGGVFARLPEHFERRGDFAQALGAAARQQHGTAIRRFLKKLVKARAEGEGELRDRINYHVRSFRRLAGVTGDDGSQNRVAEAFGLVVAAGRLAKHFKVLPKELDCEAVALACYRLYRPVSTAKPSVLDQLAQLARDPKTINLDAGPLRQLTNNKLNEHGVFIHRNRRGQRELLCWPAQFQRRFPDYGRILRQPEVVACMKADKDRPTIKRPIRASREDRVYCFVLPD